MPHRVAGAKKPPQLLALAVDGLQWCQQILEHVGSMLSCQ